MNTQINPQRLQIIKYATVLLGLALLSVCALVVFLLQTKPGLADTFYIKLDKLGVLLLSKQTEALFFIGALIISLVQLSEKKWWLAKISFAVGCLWVVFHDSLTTWFFSLGVDSFAEAQNFDWEEAWFYFETLQTILKPNLSLKQFVLFGLYLVIGIAIFWTLRKLSMRFGLSSKKISYAKFTLGCVFITASLHLIFTQAIKTFDESRDIFAHVTSNFQNPLPNIHFQNAGMKVVVYIGESTSMMNMSLYGYPRKTTPQLDNLYANDSNFLRFSNVFSTHTHTSQSLLEALSVDAVQGGEMQPITARKRNSLVDILKSGNINSTLFSNQGEAGTWNLASSIIFKQADKTFSTNSKAAGNADSLINRPNDHAFFAQHFVPKIQSLPSQQSAVVFLHSYSGHGDYLQNIPENFRQPVDGYVASIDPRALVGVNTSVAKDVDAYDSAIKYVDFSVAKIVGELKDNPQPAVLIYFSDHGDAAFTARGHDSSRFIHEMARVPFIVYFNAKAREAYPALFEKYRHLADGGVISTLAQVPATVIDLLGGHVDGAATPLLNPVGSGSAASIQPIVIRETTVGGTYVNLNPSPAQNADRGFTSGNDMATDLYVTASNNASKNTRLCYGRANTVAKALRGALVSDCLQFYMADELIGSDAKAVIAVAKAKKLAFWLDSGDLINPDDCNRIVADLNGLDAKNVLVSFSPVEGLANPELLTCANKLTLLGFHTGYNIPKNQLIACENTLMAKPDTNDATCKVLEDSLQKIVASQAFTDFSFDFDGIHAMENSFVANQLSWSARNVAVNQYANITPARFRMVMFSNDDPNGL